MPPNPSRGLRSNKFDAADTFRAEIERRTQDGETCEQIAKAIRAQGFEISNKTISRRRVEWGFRKRPFSLKERPPPDPTRRLAKESERSVQRRKEEITTRTRNGESAEQILDAMTAAGHVFKKGVATVWRLQTYWKLIPPDKARSRGKWRLASGRLTPPRTRAGKEITAAGGQDAEQEDTDAEHEDDISLSDGSLGDDLGTTDGIAGETAAGHMIGSGDGNAGFGNSQMDFGSVAERQTRSIFPNQPLIGDAEMKSVDLLVELATSTLGAAKDLKEMMLAAQDGRPALNSKAAFPPTLEEIAAAKKTIRTAAALMAGEWL